MVCQKRKVIYPNKSPANGDNNVILWIDDRVFGEDMWRYMMIQYLI